jgi:hypothetical protein
MPKFDRRFQGPDNAGLREKIREAAGRGSCGVSKAKAVLVLARTVALTTQGQKTLEEVANDYRCSAQRGA